jgi:hypothetical protein
MEFDEVPADPPSGGATGLRPTSTPGRRAQRAPASQSDSIDVKVALSVNHSPAPVPGGTFMDPSLPDTTGTSIVRLSGLPA